MSIEAHVVWREGFIPLLVGIGLGLAYFGGLWWTSQRVGRVAWPGAFFFASFAVRLALLLGGIWLVTEGRLVATGLCVAGIMTGRQFMVVRVRGGGNEAGRTGREDGDSTDQGQTAN